MLNINHQSSTQGGENTLYNTGLTLEQLLQIKNLIHDRHTNDNCDQCELLLFCESNFQNELNGESEVIMIERWAADYPELIGDITDRYK